MYKDYYSCLKSNIPRIFVKRGKTYSLRACHDLERIRFSFHIEIDESRICVYGVRLCNYLS